jgi:hypothetical protein
MVESLVDSPLNRLAFDVPIAIHEPLGSYAPISFKFLEGVVDNMNHVLPSNLEVGIPRDTCGLDTKMALLVFRDLAVRFVGDYVREIHFGIALDVLDNNAVVRQVG